MGIDDDAAAAQLMAHVLGHGRTEIATVIGPRFSTASLAREIAFVRTAALAGVTISGSRKVSTRLNAQGGIAAAQRLLRSPDRPEAVVCGSDEIAIGVMEYALSLGLRIPDDLLVVGSEDRAILPETAFAVRDRLADARVELMRGLGHLAHEEAPERVAEAIFEEARAAGIIREEDPAA